MKNFKAIYFLQSFSIKEIKRFGEFINSTYFNKNKNVINVFDYYKENFHITKELEKSFYDLEKDLGLDKNNLNKVMSELHKLIEKFICINNIEGKPNKKSQVLLEYCFNNNLEYNFDYYNRVLEKSIKKDLIRNESFFALKLKRNRLLLQKQSLKENRSLGFNLKEYFTDLDKYFLLRKLELAIFSSNLSNVFSSENNSENVLSTINLAKKIDIKNEILIDLYIEVVALLEEKEKETHFFKIREIIKKNIERISKEDLINFYIILRNNVKKIYKGDRLYKELFELNKETIELNLHKVNAVIIPPVFNNFITCALKINELDWSIQFIENEGKFLDASIKEDYILFNKARISFFKKDYKSSIQLLNSCNPVDIFFKAALKRLYLKASFEEKDFSLFESTSLAFKMFLYRDKELSKKVNKANADFLSFTNKLFKLSLVDDYKKSDKLKKLKTQLETKNLPDKSWLLEKTRTKVD